ncbi:MAG: pentapeptide repeat-containing protein [Bacteroidetes bacterium]|nr:MAG: pentapeptide repeat-containing protein [Bacteroidota bacterium]
MANLHQDKIFNKIIYKDVAVKDKEFIKCKFTHCDFSNITFEDCEFEDCFFENCNLSTLKVKYSRFSNVTFKSCKMIGIAWDEASMPFSISCEDSNISYSSFYGMKLKKMKIHKCIAHDVNFSEADMQLSKFNYTDLQDSIFQNTNLMKANFENAFNYNGIDLLNGKIKKAVFSMPEALVLLSNFDIILK